MRKTNDQAGFGALFTATTALVSPAHEMITHRSLYDAVKQPQKPSRILSLALRTMARLDVWRQRRNQRLHLGDLSDQQLQDIGIERHQVADELSKPFWR